MVIDGKYTVKTITFLLLTCAFIFAKSPLLKAQNSDGELYGEYAKTAGSKAVLYRGKLPDKYLYAFNGTPFWESRTFVPGEVKYNGKIYRDVLLNIDACRMEVLCRYSSDVSPVVLSRQLVQYAKLGGVLYVNLNNLGYEDAPEGYFQVTRDGEAPVLRQIRKIFRTDSHDHNGADIGYYDPNYNERVTNYFRQEEKFYTIKEGAIKRIGKRAAAKAAASASTPFLESKAGVYEGTDAAPEGQTMAIRPRITGLGLPDGYFDANPNKDIDLAEDNASITATYRNKLYVIGQGEGNSPVTVEGVVTEMETGLPMYGVVIFDDNTSTYDRSRKDGTYRITLPGGENRLNFKAEGKEDITLRVKLQGDGTLNIEMPDRIESLEAAVVSAESMENHRSAAMGIESLSIRTMTKIPSAFGEGDLLKAVLTLPGVKSVGEASGGFNVRGGSQDQNLILFNGNTIYNPSHLFGIFSAFNPDIVESVELFKSVIPAEYGGRISSVLTVKSRDGNRERLKGSAGIGPLTSRLQLDGPIGKKTSFNVAARTSYSDWILKKLPKNSSYSGGTANFMDANAGITHRFNQKSTLRLNGYFAHDVFSFSKDTSYRYTNLNVSTSYDYKAGEKAFSISAGYDRFSNRTTISSWGSGAFNLETYIRQLFLRTKAALKAENHDISYGADVVGYGLDPGILTPATMMSTVIPRALEREYAIEPALFAQDTWTVSELFSLEGGLRLSGYSSLNDGKFYAGPELRLSGRYSPAVNLSFKGGFNTMRQYIHLISNNAGISPMDTWKLSDGNIAPTTGWQAAAGAYWTLLGSGVDLSAEVYYKRSKNGLDFKPGAILTMNEKLYQELVPVYGRSYGVELMAKKTTGKLTGWASYSYSKAQYKEMGDRGYAAVAAGNWYNTSFDKPHEAKLSANYAITHRYSVSVNADYSTGRPVTVPVGVYVTKNAVHMAYSERNSYRLPDYFRLDAAINIDPGHYKKSIFHTTFTVGVYNITGRKNAYSAFFKADERGQLKSYMLSVFATRIPYANINILF